jgi:NAD(P)-dependent dehydrogenase (short-subunit alcohol dehydrogenase family)
VREFNGLVAVVTGGASGIGAAIVQRLNEGGAKVSIFDVDRVRNSSHTASLLVNISDDGSVKAGIRDTVARFGKLDILINCAGIGAQGEIVDNTDEEWLKVFNVNVLGLARVTREAMPHLLKSKVASVVNISSIAATAGLPKRVLYSASKGAVSAMTRAMAADHIHQGVRFNSVNPGTADTPWVDRLLADTDDPHEERLALNGRQPHGRLVTAEEIAEAVVYLASPKSGSTTGASIAVDGGMQNLRLRPEVL